MSPNLSHLAFPTFTKLITPRPFQPNFLSQQGADFLARQLPGEDDFLRDYSQLGCVMGAITPLIDGDRDSLEMLSSFLGLASKKNQPSM